MFHDESTHVIKKATTTAVAKRKPRRLNASGPSTRGVTFNFLNGWGDKMDLVAHNIAPTYQEQGIAFFFSRYVAADKGCFQNYDFIYDIWTPPKDMMNPDPITSGITAVGLAGLAKAIGCEKTMTRARQCYGAALQRTNAALRDPAQAVTDASMLSVLLLATYEFMSGKTPQTVEAWRNHVNGAAAVAVMRGKEQFATYGGVRMFILLSISVLVSCVQSGLPIPDPIIKLRRDLVAMGMINEPANYIVELLAETLQLRHDIEHGKLPSRDEIIAKLTAMDEKFDKAIANLPTRFFYRVVRLSTPHKALFGDSCHVYPGLTPATTWNLIRTMRILIQESIIDQICKDRAEQTCCKYQPMMVKAIRMIRILSDAIVASVPQHFGVINWESTVEAQAVAPGVAMAEDVFTIEGVRERFENAPVLMDPELTRYGADSARFLNLVTSSDALIWPLYIMGMSSTCCEEMREYVVDRLNDIFLDTGVAQAKEVSELVKLQKGKMNTWARSSMLFSVLLPAHSLPSLL